VSVTLKSKDGNQASLVPGRPHPLRTPNDQHRENLLNWHMCFVMSVFQSKSKRHNYAEFVSGLNSILTAINQRVFKRTTDIYFKNFTLQLNISSFQCKQSEMKTQDRWQGSRLKRQVGNEPQGRSYIGNRKGYTTNP